MEWICWENHPELRHMTQIHSKEGTEWLNQRFCSRGQKIPKVQRQYDLETEAGADSDMGVVQGYRDVGCSADNAWHCEDLGIYYLRSLARPRGLWACR